MHKSESSCYFMPSAKKIRFCFMFRFPNADLGELCPPQRLPRERFLSRGRGGGGEGKGVGEGVGGIR